MAEVTFGDALGNIVYGISTINPDNLCNNCVSVSLAHLLDFDNVEALWQKLLGTSMPDQALNIYQVSALLDKTDYIFRGEGFSASATRSAYQNFVKSYKPTVSDSSAIPARQLNTQQTVVLILYTRADGSGHCVNGIRESFGRPYETKHLKWRFVDYQHDEDGQPAGLEADVKNAKDIIVVIAYKRK